MRAFVAVEIDNADIIQKIKSIQETATFEAKPVRIDQIHFTLQFLGEISNEKAEKVKSVLNKISFPQFELSLKGVGGFPNLKNPRVIWVGTDKGGQKISEIAKKIGIKLSKLGFKEDKKFNPHLTIFRVKKKINDISSLMKEFEAVEFGTQMISQIKLKKSVLSPKGPEYSDLLEVNAK